MTEIKRLQQLAGILSEIKINNPRDRFTVTPKGKEMLDNFNKFWVAARNLGVGDMMFDIDEIFEQYPQLRVLIYFQILSNYGEDIIKIDGVNDLNQVIKDYTDKIGDEDDIKNQLRMIKKQGYITDINL